MTSLILDIVTDKREYQIGESVEVGIILRNVGQSAASLTFTTSQVFDLVVKRAEEVVYVWSKGRVFAQVIDEFNLAPSDVIERKLSWTPRASGSYVLEGQTPRFIADGEELMLKTRQESVVVHT
jgi:hypothetical protein